MEAVPLRVGRINYANCTPIFTALQKNFDCGAYRFIHGVPSRLNQMLSRGELDLSPSSSIVYGRSFEQFLLLPDLSINSDGPVRSVLLFSRFPIDDLDGQTVCLTSESETSVVLLKIILRKYFGFKNRFVRKRLSSPVSEFPAFLVIGDTALKWSFLELPLYKYDLGELWKDLTGLPFVFALWILRKDAAKNKFQALSRIRAQLSEAKCLALSSLELIAKECSEREWMGLEGLISYWKSISYDLSGRQLRGLEAFFRDALEIGALGMEPELRFF